MKFHSGLMPCPIFHWPPSSLFADISRLLFLLRLKTHQGYQSKKRVRGGGEGTNFECSVPQRLSLHIRHIVPPTFSSDFIPGPFCQYSSGTFPNNQSKCSNSMSDATPTKPLVGLGVSGIAVDPVGSARPGPSSSSTEEYQDAEKRHVPPPTGSFEASHRWMQFEDARDLVRRQGFLLRSHFWAWKERPRDIPYNPDKMYKLVGWAGIDHWICPAIDLCMPSLAGLHVSALCSRA
jgi:hypothetical protein